MGDWVRRVREIYPTLPHNTPISPNSILAIDLLTQQP